MKSIIVGSIVLCKMLVSEPNIKNNENQGSNVSVGNRNIFAQEIAAPLIKNELRNRNLSINSEKSEIKEIIDTELEEGVEVVIGEVVNIVDSKKWKKNTLTGKYFEEVEKSFFVKNDKYHTIKFKESSCGLKSDWVDGSLSKKKDQSNKKKINKKNKVTKSTNSDIIIEEYLIVPIDYKLKDGEYEVTDKKIKDKIIKVVKDEKGVNLIDKKIKKEDEIPTISYDKEPAEVKKEDNHFVDEVKDEGIKKVVKTKSKKEIKINKDEIPTSIFSSFEEEEIPKVVIKEKKEVEKTKPKKKGQSLWSSISSKFNGSDTAIKSNNKRKSKRKEIVSLNNEKKIWKEFLSVLFLEF